MVNFYFFPFTFMDGRQAKALSCFFNSVNVLDLHGGAVLPGPMAGLEARGCLARVCLDQDRLDRAEQKVRNYLDWAAVHKGNEKNLRALIRESVFFKDDSGVAAIRAGIRTGAAPRDKEPAIGPDSIDSLVFLKLADIHDRESRDIQMALDALDRENAALFAELKGDGEMSPAVDQIQSPEPGRIMTEKRIEAWLGAAVDAEWFDQGGIPVLITTSRAVMDEFSAHGGKAINALDIDSIKVHENDCEFIKQRHLGIKAAIEQMARGLTPDFEKNYFEDAARGAVNGRIQIRLFQGPGNMNLAEKNPGGQIGVCLVELNS